MHHFAYRDGVLHAEDVDLRRIADEVGTPFYCYSTATLERHYRVFAEAFADTDALVCYAMKANSNQAVLRRWAAWAPAWTSSRRANCAGRSPPACPAERIVFSGVGKTRPEMAFALDSGILCFNVESEPELRSALRGRRLQGNACADLDPHQPGRGRQDPQEDLDRQVGEQVRHSHRPRPRRLCAGGRSQGHRGHRRRHAYRQPDHRSRPLRQRHRAARRARPRPHGRRPQAASHRSRRRPRRALSRGQRAPARSAGLCGDHQAPHQGSRPQARLRDGPHDRRQCGRARRAGDLREARAPTSPS